MKGDLYRERDYSFGQTMLTLRTAIGMTQAGLAGFVGVSRRAVGDWEAGVKYPSSIHLKQFIVLALKHEAFQAGHEVEEVKAFWHAAHQKVLLDDAWLAGLLPYAEAPPALQTAEETSGAAQALAPRLDGPRVDWGDALAVPSFYGREWEMDLLTEWVVQERCRVVSVFGLGGIGKSALSVSLMHQVAEHFEVVIWRSLRDLPICEVLLNDLLRVLAPQLLGQLPASTEQRLSILLEHLRSTRVLVVLDNVESVMEEGEGIGRMRPGYEGFGRFLSQSAATEHQSCVLLTSREKPSDLLPYEGSRSPVRALRLARLDADACEELLAEKGATGTAAERARLIETYAGNPLALKIVAQTVVDLFDGQIAPFLEHGEVVFGGIRDLLSEQFARLSPLEQSVLLWLAILREPSDLGELQAVLVMPVPRSRLLEAVEALSRRSLIERSRKPGSFTLQSVVLEYATAQLISEASDEIQKGKLACLIEHGLALAQSSEYVRQNQERLIVAPLLACLRNAYRQQTGVEESLLALLAQLATWGDGAQGYGPANLVALLCLQRGDLRGVDLSRLLLRGVYLQGVEMQDASLSQAVIQNSAFTGTFDDILAVAISSTGAYWAAASRRGEIRIWEEGGLVLYRVWRAHTDMAWTLAFSPDGRTLASGSWDGMVKLWDVASGSLLWSGQHAGHVDSVAFSPDGSVLASSGHDATVRLWDLRYGTQLQALSHPSPVSVVVWNPHGHLLASGDMEGIIRLWDIPRNGPATCVQRLAGHTNYVDGLAFTSDGSILASGSWDGTVKLWEVASGCLRQTLAAHSDRVRRVAWSPDGGTLVTSSRDQKILLWDADQGGYRAVLQGNTGEVWTLAFTPDSRLLLSGGEDGTLRVWDVASKQCVRVMQGHGAALYDVDWSPDGTQVVGGSSDALVTIYTVNGGTPPRVLRGHRGVVFGVGWSPDGRQVATSECDNAVRLWDPTSGACLDVLQHPNDEYPFFRRLAWSPDGQRLACGTYRSGVHVFDIVAQHPRWAGQQLPTYIRNVAWSPEGTQLAGGGDDGVVYLWDAEESTLLQGLVGHHGIITCVAWSPDGTLLASGGSGIEGGELFVWDHQRGERVDSMTGHPGTVSAVSWGPNERLLISGGSDGTLRWWDVQRGECLLACDAHQGTVQSLRRSPDGTKLASCGDDGAIMLWDLRTGESLQTLRRDRPYERLNINGIRGLTDVQRETLRALGAIEDSPVLSVV